MTTEFDNSLLMAQEMDLKKWIYNYQGYFFELKTTTKVKGKHKGLSKYLLVSLWNSLV